MPGLGDYWMGDVTAVEDPCPPPAKTVKKKRLDVKEKKLYAPMANLGDVTYDADAVYVQIPDAAVRFTELEGQLDGKAGAPKARGVGLTGTRRSGKTERRSANKNAAP